MFEIRELTVTAVAIRVVAAVILGGIIGLERGLKNRPAGLRTNMLVCLGACIVMMTNQYIYQTYASGDPVRMAAQVVSGIGFLGAGTIIVTSHNRIKGLTTAAGLWSAACVGLALGIGLYEVALIGGAAVFLVLTLLQLWDGFMHRNSKTVEVYVELMPQTSLGEFLSNSKQHDLTFSSVQIEHSAPGTIAFFATVKSKKRGDHETLLETIRTMEGVRFSETL